MVFCLIFIGLCKFIKSGKCDVDKSCYGGTHRFCCYDMGVTYSCFCGAKNVLGIIYYDKGFIYESENCLNETCSKETHYFCNSTYEKIKNEIFITYTIERVIMYTIIFGIIFFFLLFITVGIGGLIFYPKKVRESEDFFHFLCLLFCMYLSKTLPKESTNSSETQTEESTYSSETQTEESIDSSETQTEESTD